MTDEYLINVSVNKKNIEKAVSARLTLADFLRYELNLTGTHIGCEHGVCGACTVLYDGKPVRSCLMFAVQADKHEILTIESYNESEELTSLQEQFCNKHALQCGFCTPGMIIAVEDFLNKATVINQESIRNSLSGNICRCTGYTPIVEAVLSEAKLRGLIKE